MACSLRSQELTLDFLQARAQEASTGPGQQWSPPSGEPEQPQRPQLSRQTTERHIPIPPIPSSFPELQTLTLAELQVLQADLVAFKQFFRSLEPVKLFSSMRDDILTSNANCARE